MAEAERNLWIIRRAIRSKKDILRSYPNVITVCAAKKEVGGKVTDEWAACFLVDSKVKNLKHGRIPKKIMVKPKNQKGSWIHTDVVQAQVPLAAGLRGGHLVLSHDNEQGVLFVASSKNGSNYAITNSHVVTDVDQPEMSGRVSAFDTQDNRFEEIGVVIAATPLLSEQINDMDAALIKIDSNIEIDRRRILGRSERVSRFDYFRTEEPGTFYYCANGEVIECRRPRPILVSAPVRVEGKTLMFDHCWRLDVVRGHNREGHSGSMIYKPESDGLRACGIVFAGIENRETWAFSAKRVINRFRPFM